MADDVSARILAAATLAEQHAEKMTNDAAAVSAAGGFILDWPGPSHWEAVAVGLRAIEATHDRYWRACSQGEHHCRHGYIACENLGALLPLADQIIQDLAELSSDLID